MGPRLVVVDHESSKRHNAGPMHPECPERIDAVESVWLHEDLAPHITRLQPTPATLADLHRAHTAQHIEMIRRLSVAGGGYIDSDTHVSPASWEAASHGAGAGLAAISAIDSREADIGFVSVRPPGHHATANESMGFCLINNVAVAAAALADDGHRVAIIDWDVHHGNGTQDIFWNNPHVLFVSLHQQGIYPGTGHQSERGGPQSDQSTLNLPLPSGSTGDVFSSAFDGVVRRTIERFDPEWILVSAGYDGHRRDPMASLSLTAGDYADLADMVTEFASRKKLILFLEGGYDLDALHESVTATTRRLVGLPHVGEAPSKGGPGHEQVAQISFDWEKSVK